MEPKLVEVATYRHYGDAATAKALLDASGIATVLANANSGDLFGGVLGEVRVQVAERDAARARELLRSIDRTRASPAPDDGVERCLSCGEPMAADAEACAKCGFTFGGEEEHLYANGPLPDSLLANAFAPVDSQRFALRPADVPRYLDWCARAGLEVRGYEVWGRTLIGHDVQERRTPADAKELGLAAAAAAAQAASQRSGAPELLFSPDVRSEDLSEE